MVRNPFRNGKRKPWQLPPKTAVVAVEVKASEGFFGKLKGLKKVPGILKNVVRAHPHLFIVGLTFIGLFTWDYINLITFISLGFFCLLFSDHIVDNVRTYLRNKQEQKENAIKSINLLGPSVQPGFYRCLKIKRESQTQNQENGGKVFLGK